MATLHLDKCIFCLYTIPGQFDREMCVVNWTWLANFYWATKSSQLPSRGGEAEYTESSLNIVFFHNSMQPLLLAYIAVRDLQSSQRYASVQSFLLGGHFLYKQ